MKFARVMISGKEMYGIIKENCFFHIEAIQRNDMGIENYLSDPELLATIDIDENKCYPLDKEDLEWMAPVARPGKIVCIGKNYAEHAIETGEKPESIPLIFSKYASSITSHLSEVPFPGHSEYLDYEVELAVVFGKKASKLTEDDDPYDYVFGYTVANDLTARDVQKSEKQWTRGKAFDNSLPLGPYIITKDKVDPMDQEIWLTLNGESRQRSNTKNMIFSVPYLIRYISQEISFEPGDILLTGTPEGVGYYMDPRATLQKGDHVACGVTNVCELRFSIKN